MKPSDRCSFIFVKCLVVLLGCIAIGLLFLVEKLGGVLVVSIFSINIFINYGFLRKVLFLYYFNIISDNWKFSSNSCRHFFWSVYIRYVLSMGKF